MKKGWWGEAGTKTQGFQRLRARFPNHGDKRSLTAPAHFRNLVCWETPGRVPLATATLVMAYDNGDCISHPALGMLLTFT